MSKLPIDISTFSELRTSDYLYVDKTEYIYKMITGGRRFFLSRPRRFGKSLLVSTLKEILTANKSLFDGLWINKSDYSWKKHGVINLDFSLFSVETLEVFKNELKKELLMIGRNYDIHIPIENNTLNNVLKDLAYELFIRFGRVAILIDEYDSPILKILHNEDLAKDIRDTIQQFFTVIKSLDAQVQFVFITGVSSFAKAGLFSGINNLQILTLRDEFGTICGYTDEEIDHYFNDHIEQWAQKKGIPFDDLRKQIKQWYNGYHFGENTQAVYNPFSFMNALHINEFENFWFQSGTPKFLVDILKKERIDIDLENLVASKDFLGAFDVDYIPPVSLMFQAGYLTIVGYNARSQVFNLDYPNFEVRRTFQKYLLEIFANIKPVKADELSSKLYDAFNDQDIDKVIDLLYQFFVHIPYQIHMKEEKYYHSLFMMICIGAQIKVQSEYSTSLGSIDLVLEFPAFAKASAGAVRHSFSDGGQVQNERDTFMLSPTQFKKNSLTSISLSRSFHLFKLLRCNYRWSI